MHVFRPCEEFKVPGENPCKFHRERPQLRIKPETLLLCGDGVNHHTTVKPNMQHIIMYQPQKISQNVHISANIIGFSTSCRNRMITLHVLFKCVLALPCNLSSAEYQYYLNSIVEKNSLANIHCLTQSI